MCRKKVVGYVRVSSLDQIDNTSLTDQERKIKMYCELHDLELIQIYKDEGETGSKIECRDDYNRMIEYVTDKSKEIAAVVVLKIDRIHRSGKNLLIMVEDQLQPAGVGFVSISENFDTNTPQGKLFLTMLGGFAEFERAQINARTKSGRIATANNQAHAGGAIAFGYQPVKDGNTFIEINGDEAQTVVKIFALRAEGDSLGRIAAYLNAAGILHDGKEWSRQAIDYILKNETYIGKYTYNGKKEKNGITYVVPKIVSKQLWNKCRK